MHRSNTMPRVVICGTYPTQYNGYSKVVYELTRELAKFNDIETFVFGFQNFYDHKMHDKERELPSNVSVFDAAKHENPKNKGFGESLVVDYVKEIKPDVVIVYNDLAVLALFLEKLHSIPDRTFKIVPYIDLVYRNERTSLMNFVNNHSDAGIFFTKYWEEHAKHMGFNKPSYVMEHGFNNYSYYHIDKPVARAYFNIPDKDFIIVNLNRNQPRKRWDQCIMAFVKFLSMHENEPIKLLIATALTGAWDIVEVFVSECRKYGLNPEVAKNNLIIVQNPQTLTDREINIMYNVADVGWNTCDGEGFGLCNFEQAAIGIPQVVPYIGGFRDFFNKDNSIIIPPKWSHYMESSRDIVGGEGQICDIDDYVSALEQYYSDPNLRAKHGQNARKLILENYKWPVLAARLRDIIIKHSPTEPRPMPSESGITTVTPNNAMPVSESHITMIAPNNATPASESGVDATPVPSPFATNNTITASKSVPSSFATTEPNNAMPVSKSAPTPITMIAINNPAPAPSPFAANNVAPSSDVTMINTTPPIKSNTFFEDDEVLDFTKTTEPVETTEPVIKNENDDDDDEEIDINALKHLNAKINKMLAKLENKKATR